MKVALILAVVGLAAADCPQLTCTGYLDPGICGFRAPGSNSFLVKPCGAGQSCAPPHTLSDSTLLTCSPDQSSTVQFLIDLQGSFPQIRYEGESCGGGSVQHCFDEDGLVCYCEAECRCVKGGQPKDDCSTKGCAWGSSCLGGVCTKWFTQAYGVSVPDPRLCQAMNVDAQGACLRSDTSSHNLFAPCSVDSDCTGVNGTRGRCHCGLLGKAYCDLKPGDKPYLLLQQAYLDKSVRDVLYWKYIVENWAFLQRNDGNSQAFGEFPACVDQVWPQLEYQLRALPAMIDFLETAGLLGFLGLYLFI